MDTVSDIFLRLLLEDLQQFLLVVWEVKTPGLSNPVVVWNRLHLRSDRQLNPFI